VKTCTECGKNKPYIEFYKHSGMSDGYLNICKICKCAQQRATRKRRLEYYRNYDNRRSTLPHRVKARAKRQRDGKSNPSKRKWNNNNPEKVKAINAANNAVRDGKLKRQPCERCDATHRIQKHHNDYSKPLEVRWLCSKCHNLEHKELG